MALSLTVHIYKKKEKRFDGDKQFFGHHKKKKTIDVSKNNNI